MEQIAMPQLGETVTEGTVTRWLKQVGDAVAEDDPLFEVSTDKVDTEVPSAHAGYLRALLVEEGDTVPIGTPLAVLTATADEPIAVPARTERGVDHGSRPALRPSAHDASSPTTLSGATDDASFLSPVVRRLLDEHHMDPSEVTGSGRGGRITRNDVSAVASNRRSATSAQPAPQPVATAAPVPPAVAGPDDDVVAFSKARRTTAANMLRSLGAAAHTLVVTEVDYAAVDRARRAVGLTYLPYVARAVVDAIRERPELNASVGDGELVVHRRIHLGIAVDLDASALVVPVVRDAGALRLRPLADRIADVAARAKARHLTADDLQGATITITNVGSYGTLVTAPIINQPQVAILSTDGVAMKPVAVRTTEDTWGIAVHPVGNLSLSFDHRAFDGAYAAAFLAHVRELLQTRDWGSET
ncbi:MAG: 2-oxo acid dehydrogenase subunit E2 [Actinomycetota bacterium]|nr:2-oxo acid dehydrogenase subunit E2 [Actinomycetota bacterium]